MNQPITEWLKKASALNGHSIHEEPPFYVERLRLLEDLTDDLTTLWLKLEPRKHGGDRQISEIQKSLDVPGVDRVLREAIEECTRGLARAQEQAEDSGNQEIIDLINEVVVKYEL